MPFILAFFQNFCNHIGLLRKTMAVGAQNDLGGHQTFARKMT